MFLEALIILRDKTLHYVPGIYSDEGRAHGIHQGREDDPRPSRAQDMMHDRWPSTSTSSYYSRYITASTLRLQFTVSVFRKTLSRGTK